MIECEVGKFSSGNETLSPLFYIGRVDGMLTVCPVKEVMLSSFRVVCWYVLPPAMDQETNQFFLLCPISCR